MQGVCIVIDAPNKQMTKTSNSKARPLVENRENFKGSNTYGINSDTCYTVYSYGTHFPLFVYAKRLKVWIENKDRYSVSTSKHKSQLRPQGVTLTASTGFLKQLINIEDGQKEFIDTLQSL
jgi:uncharacterized protein (UPF0333 family)